MPQAAKAAAAAAAHHIQNNPTDLILRALFAPSPRTVLTRQPMHFPQA
jgi:hypothetical protein